MFGALLGTLNSFQKQTTGKDSKIARQTEKRAEIDARVKEQLAREKEELEGMKEAADRERRDKAEQAKLKIISERVTPPPLGAGYHSLSNFLWFACFCWFSSDRGLTC